MRVLKLPEVIHLTGKSKTQIYLDMRKGTFPLPIQVGVHSVGWIDDEVFAFLDECKRVRDTTDQKKVRKRNRRRLLPHVEA